MKREFKSGEVVLEVYDASLRIVMDHLLPPYEENGECSYTILSSTYKCNFLGADNKQ